jgi:ABC-type phosphate transport system permease subunit
MSTTTDSKTRALRGSGERDRAARAITGVIAFAVTGFALLPFAMAAWTVPHQYEALASLMDCILPMLRSLALTAAAFAIAAPLALGAALTTLDHRNSRTARYAIVASRLLAAIPGIVLSIVGALIARQAGNWIGAVVALSLVALPRLLWDLRRALYRVPLAEREAALALGASESALVRDILLNRSRNELVAALLKNAAVCLGASACLLLLPAGDSEFLTLRAAKRLVQTMPSEFEQTPVHAILVLLVLCAALQITASSLNNRRRQ